MQTEDKAASFNWDDAGPDWQTTEPSINITLPEPERDFQTLLDACGRGAACACGVTGGFLASHFGCAVSPLIAISTGLSGSTLPYLSALTSLGGTVAGLVATTGAMTLWYRGWSRKKEELSRILDTEKAAKLQKSLELNKTLTIGGALAGMVLTVSFNLFADPQRQQNMQTAMDIYNIQETNGMNDIGQSSKSPMDVLRDMLIACGLMASEVPKTVPSGPDSRP